MYAPRVIADQIVVDLGRKVAQSGCRQAISSGAKAYNSEAGGIPFRVYVDLKSGNINNYHPREGCD